MKSSKNKSNTEMQQLCYALHIVIAVIAVLAFIFAIIGVYKAHFLSEGATFGTANGSLSLIALAFTLFLVKKTVGFCCCGHCDMKK